MNLIYNKMPILVYLKLFMLNKLIVFLNIAYSVQPTKPETVTEPKRSKVEIYKEQSNYIRYPLIEELLTEASNINEPATQMIKFHGSYQQYNRDERGPKSYSFMLRTKNPCGKVSNQLYLTMDDLADQFGIGTLRLTTRQTFQLHGVLKKDLKTVMSCIIKSMGSTLGACGDLNRNVLAPAAPLVRKDYLFAQQTAENIASLLTPQSGFYYDVWVDGEKIMTAEPPEVTKARNDNSHGTNFPDSPEPIYGTQFLPRKFKIAVTVPTDNSVDILTNDIGVVVVSDDDGKPQGFNIYVRLTYITISFYFFNIQCQILIVSLVGWWWYGKNTSNGDYFSPAGRTIRLRAQRGYFICN